jgi:hypothetical protein
MVLIDALGSGDTLGRRSGTRSTVGATEVRPARRERPGFGCVVHLDVAVRDRLDNYLIVADPQVRALAAKTAEVPLGLPNTGGGSLARVLGGEWNVHFLRNEKQTPPI